MKTGVVLILVLSCIAMILAAGCTDSGSSESGGITPTPEVIYITVTVTPTATHCYWNPQTMSCGDQPYTTAPTTAAVTTVTTSAPDPILHRWIRQYAGGGSGYEFQFYPDGTVVYKLGPIITVNNNLKIPSPTTSGSGSWSKIGTTDYLVKIWYTGNGGSPDLIRDYSIVPQYAMIPLHLVSSYEQADVDAATTNGTIHSFSTDVFYLEQAPQDNE